VSDLPPADWYTDPDDESQFRYWDGSAWTEHRAPRGGETATGQGLLRRPGLVLTDTFSILGRRWRSCVAAALVYFAGLAAMLVLGLVAGNAILGEELDEAWSRISDPGFDPASEEHTTYFESLEVDLSPTSLAAILLGVVALWIAGNIMRATVARVAVSDLRDRDLAPSEALRQALRRVARLLGLDLQLAAMAVLAMLVLVVAAAISPLLLILLIPALMVGAVYGSVVVWIAYVAASVGPASWSLGYGARLIRGRFWATFGRMLLVLAALAAAYLAFGLVAELTGSASDRFLVVSTVAQTVAATAAGVVALVATAIIYHDLGGESD